MRPRPLAPMPRRRRRRKGRPGRIAVTVAVLALAAAAAWLVVRPAGRQEALALGAQAHALVGRAESLLPHRASASPPRLEPLTRPGRPPAPALPGAGSGRITHAQLAELLTAAWGLVPTDIGPAYGDVGIHTPGRAAIEAAAGAGDFGVAPGGRFRPASPVTRLFLAQALVGALALGPEAARLNRAPAVSDAGAIPARDWGAARLALGLGLLPALHGAFQPDAYVTPAAAQAAIRRARQLPGDALARVLGPMATSVTAVVRPTVLEPGQTASLSAAVHDGELALPVPVSWSASGGQVAGGVFLPAPGATSATVSARVAGGRAVARVRVVIQAPLRLVAVSPPPAVLADQSATFSFAVVDRRGRRVRADDGRRVAIRLVPPSGPVVTAVPVDHGGVVHFVYRPSLLGHYRLEATAHGLGAADTRVVVVPGSLGSLSILSSATSLGAGGRLSLSATVLTSGTSSQTPKRVPVTVSAALQSPSGASVALGQWSAVAMTATTSPPVPVASLGPLTGPATLVVNLSAPGGAFLPARISIPVAGRGRLALGANHATITAGSALLVTADVPGSAASGAPLSLAITAPDGGPLAPMRQILNHGRAQFLLSPNQAGTYRLRVGGPGFSPAATAVVVRAGAPVRALALLNTPFPAPGAPLALRPWLVDAHANPVPGPTLDVTWRFTARPHAPWHRATVASGASLPLTKPPPGTDCSVAVRLSAPALKLASHALLPCSVTSSPALIASGTGVFLSYWVARDASPAGIVAQAVRARVHTLYVEVAIPGTGFWGEPGLDRLLTPAHSAGLSVVAWVPANLGDPARDTAAAKAALSYRTPLGQRVDGLGADFEGHLGPSLLRPYLRAVRAAAGPARVVCAVAEPPTNLIVPYALLGAYADVLMPMDYWQSTQSPVTFADAFRAVSTSVALVRSEAPDRAVVPVLQGYDPFTAGGTGVYNPGPLAEDGALAAARAAGAQGAAFFQWGTLTAAEWRVVARAGRTAF